jgi:uncharacterized UPF0160 family protein
MNCYTHSGLFHADEVFAFAILKFANICDKVVRLKDIYNIPKDGIIVDIGREYDGVKKFDHHHCLILRDDESCYASAGLIWKHFGKDAIRNSTQIKSTEIVDFVHAKVEQKIIISLDSHDADAEFECVGKNRVGEVDIFTLSNVISSFNSFDIKNDVCQNDCFEKAAELATSVLISQIHSAYFLSQAMYEFDEISNFRKNGLVIVLDKFVDWKEIVCEKYPTALFVISPSAHPGSPFSMIAVPIAANSRKLKKTIHRPTWFLGFVHQAKWIAGGKSVDELLDLAEFNLDSWK